MTTRQGATPRKIRRTGATLVALVCGCVPFGGLQANPPGDEIVWDEWGIPHIYASSRENAFYQIGWAQARAHGNLLARIYGQARGRAAEHWGSGYLRNDMLVHAMELPARSRQWLRDQGPAYRRYIRAFTDGINDYVDAHPGEIADEVEQVFPLAPVDVMANSLRSIYLQFMLESWNLAAYMNADAGAQPLGSNAWAIAPTKSASGNAMLVANPHMPWSGDLIFFETHVVTDEVEGYGVSMVGTPVLSIAFTDTHGWTHTVNYVDTMDIYELTLVDDGYLLDGEIAEFDRQPDAVVKVRRDDGTLAERTVPVLRSAHGNVVYTSDDGSRALALRYASIARSGGIEQYWEMLAANDREAFEAAAMRMQLPYFNTIYADSDGEIYYQFNAVLPERSTGDYAFWRQMLPGHRSELIWGSSSDVDALPRLLNPSTGFIQNSNDAPWSTTWPAALEADDYPRQLPPSFLYFRSQRSTKMLLGDEPISFEELVRKKQSTRMEVADRVLDELLTLARRGKDPALDDAVAVLEEWDRTASAGSTGGVLFIKWAEAMDNVTGGEQLSLRPDWFAIPWQDDEPLTTPRGIADPGRALEALKSAVDEVRTTYGSLDIAYGEVYRLRHGGRDLPAGVPHQALGAFSTGLFRREADATYSITGGETYIAVVEFGDEVQARGLLTYGNASQPDSPHRGDQLELFSERKLRRFLLERDKILAAAELREAPLERRGEPAP